MEKDEIERLAKVEERSRSNTRRLDTIEAKVEDIRELTFSIKEIATEVKMMREDVNKLDIRIENIEKEPVQEYKEIKSKIKWQIISFILGSILTGLAVYVLK